MKLILILTVTFCCAFSCFSQTNNKTIFSDLETKYLKAWKEKNLKTLNELLSEDFRLASIFTKGELMDKQSSMQAFKTIECDAFTIDTLTVSTYGNTAIVNVWTHISGKTNKEVWNEDLLNTNVWILFDSTWRLVSRHSTKLNTEK